MRSLRGNSRSAYRQHGYLASPKPIPGSSQIKPAKKPVDPVAQVLEFPSQETRAFAFLERELRALLTQKGADETLIQYAIDALTSVYREMTEAENFSFRVDLPASLSTPEINKLDQQITAGIDDLRSHHHTLALKLAARLVLTEMKLFQHQREDSESPES